MAEARGRVPRVGLVWAQFAPYHVDRCEAVAARLAGRADVVAVEIASSSALYAWSPSGALKAATKLTLFPGCDYEAVSAWRRFRALFAALRRCDTVFVGVSYGEPDIIMLALCLRVIGVHVVMMTDSKFEDVPRHVAKEFAKSLLLLPFGAALVAGERQRSFVRFLGFRRRPVLIGYDMVDTARVLAQGGGLAAPEGIPWSQRPFVFVGRFVQKKRVPFLVDCYASYVKLATTTPRRLVLVGGGPEDGAARARAIATGVDHLIDFRGFLQADGVTAALAQGLALLLPSDEEQWGLVVNEALAFHLPAIVCEAVGARDLLVRNLVNGFVIERDSADGFARAMLALAEDESLWRRMVAASAERAPRGHVKVFADAVEALVRPSPERAK